VTKECFGNDLGFLLRPNRSHTALGRISEDIIGINHALSKSSSEEYEKDLGFPLLLASGSVSQFQTSRTARQIAFKYHGRQQ